MPRKKRLDQYLVELGLTESRSKAQALIMAGKVMINNQRAKKPGQTVTEESSITVKDSDHGYVSRGGIKLAHALDSFHIDPTGNTCLDVGASTGGFTDCLLQRGADKVWAVDVGSNQLHYKLRVDPRVVCLEKTNARTMDHATIIDKIDLLVADVSFISLKLVLPPLLPSLASGADLVVMAKPQFEAGREHVSKGGVVKDENIRRGVVEGLQVFFGDLGLKTLGVENSPITGPKGNVEIFIWMKFGN